MYIRSDTMKPKQFSFSKLRQPTGQRLSNVRTQQKKFNWANLILILPGSPQEAPIVHYSSSEQI